MMQILTGLLAALAGVAAIGWIAAMLHESGLLRDVTARIGRTSRFGRVFLGFFCVALWLFGGTKPDGGTNGPQGRARSPRRAATTDARLTEDDFRRGFALTGIGTNEVFDFSMPEDAVACEDWLKFGAAKDWVYRALKDWTIPCGTNESNRVRVFSDGKIQALPSATNRWWKPLEAVVGIVPSFEWGQLAETNRPSQFWMRETDYGSVVFTWQNVPLNRHAETPVSFQAEFWDYGKFVYRYDFSRVGADAVSNIVCGVSYGEGAEWVTNSLASNVTSLSFYTLREGDEIDSDRDGDGLSTAEEILLTGTDSGVADTDYDGLNDAEELVNGTDSWNADMDGDGVLDGDELLVGSDPNVADSDSDGVDDYEEIYWYGTDPNDADTDGDGITDGVEIVGQTDPTRSDSDEDGLDDAAEILAGTVRSNPDTDGDGAPDGWEVANGSNPLVNDTDGDGMCDGLERILGSSPLLADTDGDGITDIEEFTVTKTSPTSADTDGDGLDDVDEIQEYGTDPFKADTDGDRLDDGDEVDLGTDPCDADSDDDGLEDGDEVASGADPFAADADGDGMPDVWEVRYGLDPSDPYDGRNDADGDLLNNLLEFQNGTSPISEDTDGDTLSDRDELRDGTSPILADTDGDGINDAEEYVRDINPNNPDSDFDGMPDGWEVRYGLNPRQSLDANNDRDWDGISNLAEYARGTNPQLADTDGDGLDDGEEMGCMRDRVLLDDDWASETNGWTEVEIEQIDDMPAGYFSFDEILFIGEEYAYDVLCQWNGLIFASAGGDYYLEDIVAAEPMNLEDEYISSAAVSIAPYWVESVTNCAMPTIRAFKRGSGGNVRYAVQYLRQPAGGTNVVSHQSTMIFTNGVYYSTEINYGPDSSYGIHGFNASIGVQHSALDVRHSSGFHGAISLFPFNVYQYIPGTGTNPLIPNTMNNDSLLRSRALAANRPYEFPVRFHFGDPSGSESERYQLSVTPVSSFEGDDDAPTPPSYVWENPDYGVCNTETAMLRRGWTYEVCLRHLGTKEKDGRPDYDYHISCSPPSSVGIVTNDPQRLFGENGNSGQTFEAAGKVAKIAVIDGCMVGDYDRRNGITDDDVARVYEGRRLRHWINDDDDHGEVNDGDEDIPGVANPAWLSAAAMAFSVGGAPDYANGNVDGVSDTLDFTPVWMDMGKALEQLTHLFAGTDETDYVLTLSQEDSAVNVVWTSLTRRDVNKFLTEDITGCGLDLDSELQDAEVVQLTSEETRVPDKLLSYMRSNNNQGVFLIEGRLTENGSECSEAPIVLRCYRKPYEPNSGSHLFEIKLPLSLSPVESMFRWIDERGVCGDFNGVATRLEEPFNNPDSETDDKHFVFVHGYAINAQRARGWASEMFKRLRQSGSSSKFTAVDWFGNETEIPNWIPKIGGETPNYYANVMNAFNTAPLFVTNCVALSGNKVLLAHSLGNMLVSSAIKDHGLVNYENYYMLNAAVPIEAYDISASINNAMVGRGWRSLNRKAYTGKWHELFDSTDGRSTLKWKGRFHGIERAVNFYSTTEDTLGNADLDEYLPGLLKRKKFWAVQELSKGTAIGSLSSAGIMNCEGGWGWNVHYSQYRRVSKGGYSTYETTKKFRKIVKDLSNQELIKHPVFLPFHEDWLFTTEHISNARVADIRNRILADAIPATTYAAGANQVTGNSGISNKNLETFKSSGWPRADNRWRHSDIRKIAFRYTNEFFKRLVDGEKK